MRLRLSLLTIVLGAAALPAHAQPIGRTERPDPLPAAGAASDVHDLPLIEAPAARADAGRTLVLFLSGDGGWTTIDRVITSDLTAHGVAVVGLDSRAYLSKRRTPDETARDATRALRHYLPAWGRQRVAVVGFSRGAELAPFVANRLPADLGRRVALVAMLGPATNASFEFHWSDLWRDTARPTDVPILPELERRRGTRMLCVYGTEEKDSLCRAADEALVTKVARPGAHHFDGDFHALGDLILGALGR